MPKDRQYILQLLFQRDVWTLISKAPDFSNENGFKFPRKIFWAFFPLAPLSGHNTLLRVLDVVTRNLSYQSLHPAANHLLLHYLQRLFQVPIPHFHADSPDLLSVICKSRGVKSSMPRDTKCGWLRAEMQESPGNSQTSGECSIFCEVFIQIAQPLNLCGTVYGFDLSMRGNRP